MTPTLTPLTQKKSTRAILALLIISTLTACGEDAEPNKPGRTQPDMTVTPDAPIDTPDTPIDTPDTPVDTPDMEPDQAPDMAKVCMTNADCELGTHCDAGMCQPGACREADKNVCGGCAPLVGGAPGDACGQCMKDQVTCGADNDSLVCNGDTPCSAPTVTTDEVANISQYAASLAGAVTNVGDSAISQHGFCVSKLPTPAVGSADATCSTLGALVAAGAFTEELSGLDLGTPYFVRAYAVNNVGPAYGEERAFTTDDALLPQVETVSVMALPTDGSISVSGRLDDLGIPAHTAHGVCVGTAADPSLTDGVSTCTDLGVAAATGPFTIDFQSLTLGTVYNVRAFAASDAGTSYGQNLTVTLRPAAPAIDTITKGTDAAKVTLTWEAVPGATGYKIYRDGVALTAQPIADLTFDDLSAAAGGVPTNVGLNLAASSSDPAKVTLTWSAPQVPAGEVYDYTVSAVNDGGESAQSAIEEGNRAAIPVTGYEVTINGGNPITVAALTYDDASAPAGTISQANPAASQGTSPTAVFLTLTGADAQPGAAVNYRVRARSAAGLGADSDIAQGNRAAAALTYQWQGSASTADANYSNLAGATQRDFADTTAPANEVRRFYRVVITGGPTTVTTNGVSGFRGANLPVLTTLASTNISQTGATLNARIDDLGTATTLTQHGICWSTTANPQYANGSLNCRALGSRNTTGAITPQTITGLTAGTTYNVRAFAVFDRAGIPFTVYGNNLAFPTVPAAPFARSATTNINDRVNIFWNAVPGASGYRIYRNGVRFQSTVTSTSVPDLNAPAPKVPVAPPSLVVSSRTCSNATLTWTAPPAPLPGDLANYTVTAFNASGESPESNIVQGRRAAEPITSYTLVNTRTSLGVGYTAGTTTATRSDLPLLTTTSGTVAASDGVYPTYVAGNITGVLRLRAPAPDTFELRAVNATGAGAAATAAASRDTNCNLNVQLFRGTTPTFDISTGVFAGSSSFFAGDPIPATITINDVNAPANGQVVYYRSRTLITGSSTAVGTGDAISAPDAGSRLAASPRVALDSVTQVPGPALRVSFRLTSLGVSATTGSNYGFCYTRDAALDPNLIRPGTGNANVTCTTFVSAPVANQVYSDNTVTLTRGQTYRVRAFARNPHSELNSASTGGYILSTLQGAFIN